MRLNVMKKSGETKNVGVGRPKACPPADRSSGIFVSDSERKLGGPPRSGVASLFEREREKTEISAKRWEGRARLRASPEAANANFCEAAKKHNFKNSVGQASGKWLNKKVNRLKINQLTSQKVRAKGLEPIRMKHQILSLACLPISTRPLEGAKLGNYFRIGKGTIKKRTINKEQ